MIIFRYLVVLVSIPLAMAWLVLLGGPYIIIPDYPFAVRRMRDMIRAWEPISEKSYLGCLEFQQQFLGFFNSLTG